MLPTSSWFWRRCVIGSWFNFTEIKSSWRWCRHAHSNSIQFTLFFIPMGGHIINSLRCFMSWNHIWQCLNTRDVPERACDGQVTSEWRTFFMWRCFFDDKMLCSCAQLKYYVFLLRESIERVQLHEKGLKHVHNICHCRKDFKDKSDTILESGNNSLGVQPQTVGVRLYFTWARYALPKNSDMRVSAYLWTTH